MEQPTFDPDGVGVANGAYFGLPFTAEEAAVVLLSAPWDVTVSYGAGTAAGPEAILEASTQLDFHDPYFPDAWRRGIATVAADPAIAVRSRHLRAEAEQVIAHLEGGGAADDSRIRTLVERVNEGSAALDAAIRAEASRWLDRGKIVGLVGGDHSTPYGLVRALGERYEGFGVLHVDAHRDLRDAYEGFASSHASIMYNLLRDEPRIARIVQVGVRDFSRTEERTAETSGRVVTFGDRELSEAAFCGETWDAQCRRIVAALPDAVYVSFDIDGLSPDNCPHTGTPVPGGLGFNEAVWLLRTLARSGRRIIGFDLVEVAPGAGDRTDAIVGARMLWKLCGAALTAASGR